MKLRFFIFIILSFLTITLHAKISLYVGQKVSDIESSNISLENLVWWKIGDNVTGNVSVDNEVLSLRAKDREKSLNISKRFLPLKPGESVMLRAFARTVDVQKGEISWDCARIVLLQYQNGQPKYNVHHVLVALDGSVEWQGYSKIFHIDEKTEEVKLVVQLNHSTGLFEVRDLFLEKVTNNPVYQVVQTILLTVWLLFLGSLFLSGVQLKPGRRKVSLLMVVLVLVIVAGTTMPGDLKNYIKNDAVADATFFITGADSPDIVALQSTAEGKNTWIFSVIDITKFAHFSLFFLMGTAILFGRYELNLSEVLIRSGMLACGTELMQLFVEGRSALVGDVLIDMAGCGSAVLLFWLVVKRRKS